MKSKVPRTRRSLINPYENAKPSQPETCRLTDTSRAPPVEINLSTEEIEEKSRHLSASEDRLRHAHPDFPLSIVGDNEEGVMVCVMAKAKDEVDMAAARMSNPKLNTSTRGSNNNVFYDDDTHEIDGSVHGSKRKLPNLNHSYHRPISGSYSRITSGSYRDMRPRADSLNRSRSGSQSKVRSGSYYRPRSGSGNSRSSFGYPAYFNYLRPTKEELKGPPVRGNFTCFDALCDIACIISYLFDIGSDIWLSYMYFTGNHYWWFALTLTFVLVPQIILTIISITWYVHDHKQNKQQNNQTAHMVQWIARVIFHFLQVGLVLRYIDSLVYGIRCSLKKTHKEKHRREKQHFFDMMQYEETDASLLRLIECFMESAPQLCLQLYIMTRYGTSGGVLLVVGQGVACMTALTSLAWSVTYYHRALRFSLPESADMTYLGTALMFLWRFCTIGVRVLCLALFASYFNYFVFVIVGAHWALMLVWILWQNSHFCNSKVQEVFFNAVMAIVYIFCYLNLLAGHTRLRYIFYYTVIYCENAILMLLWYTFNATSDSWHITPSLIIVLLGFFLGLTFMLTYYKFAHPNNHSIWHTSIKLWVPWRVLMGRD